MAQQHYVLRPFSAERREQWDTFINHHRQGHLLQSWSWGELKAGKSWQPLRLALCDEREDQIVAAAQILQRTISPIPARLAHLAYIPKGPVVDWTATTTDGASLAQTFLGALRSQLRGQGAWALRIEPHLEAETREAQAALICLRELGFSETPPVQPLRTITLDIQADEKDLLARMKEKWRYNVRLAGRKGVSIRIAETRADVQAWYELLQTTGTRDHFGIHISEYYLRAWELLAQGQQARLFLAYADEILLAGIFVTICAGEAIYLYGASDNAQRNLMPNYLLQWEAIRWAKQAGARSYDFWGIPPTDDANEEMAGVYRFKSGWGGRVKRFIGNYEYMYRPLPMRLVKTMM